MNAILTVTCTVAILAAPVVAAGQDAAAPEGLAGFRP